MCVPLLSEVIANDKAVMRSHPQASDVYSFAILAWQVLANELLFTLMHMNASEIKEAVVRGQRPRIPQKNDGEVPWPGGVSELLKKCWAADAVDRTSFGQVLADLQNLETNFARCQHKSSEDVDVSWTTQL